MKYAATIFIGAILGASVAHAATVAFSDFDAGRTYNPSSGASINTVFTQGYRYTSQASGQLSEIFIAMILQSGTQTGFSLSLYQDNSGALGPLLGSYAGNAVANGSVVDIPVSNSGVNLVSGQNYWLIAAATGVAGEDLAWHSATATGDPSGGLWYSNGTIGSARRGAVEVDVVPEPASAGLLMLGCCALVAQRRRLRN